MNSLASVWNSIQADEASHEQDLNIDNVHKAAKIFYNSVLNSTSQRDVSNLFKHLDKDKDGRVTKEELGQLLKESRAHSQLEYLFGLLDADKNGELSFDECITLYYLMQSRPECDHCGQLLVGMFYTCVTCWDCKNATYSLCYNCFTSKNYTHAHQEFMDNYLVLMRLLHEKITSNKIQCSVCGDIHDSNLPSYIPSGQHIVKREDCSGYICQWCLKRSCSSCGAIFSSLQSDATPRQWLMNNFYCKRCGKPGNIRDKSAVIEKLKRICSDDSTPQCDNCSFQIRKGEMFLLPSVQKQFSKSVSNKVAPAPNNITNSVAPQCNKGVGGFDIIDIAKVAITVVQASKSQPSQEASQASTTTTTTM